MHALGMDLITDYIYIYRKASQKKDQWAMDGVDIYYYYWQKKPERDLVRGRLEKSFSGYFLFTIVPTSIPWLFISILGFN